MPKAHNPRHGSMQFWPRKRAKKAYGRVRYSPESKDAKPLGFAGYKVGMTHITYGSVIPNSKKKVVETVASPVTIIECPPLKIASVRLYKKNYFNELIVAKEILNKNDKELGRKIKLPKKQESPKLDDIKTEEFDEIRINVYTQPKLTTIGKKKPELFEVKIGGKKEDQLKYVKENLNKDLNIADIFKPGQLLDFHGVTKGKGFQGPVKRFGVTLRSHKSEKVIRGPGSLGGWKSQGHTMPRVAHAGQMGYHLRTEYNKWLLLISDKAEKINPKDGFGRYGIVKNQYILVKGSVSGPKKRLLRFNLATRPKSNVPNDAPKIEYVSIESKQGK